MVRVAAVGDLHCTKTSAGELQPIFAAASRAADVLLLCGDLTDYGLPEEAEVLAGELRAALRIPALAVLGNHDHESGRTTRASNGGRRTSTSSSVPLSVMAPCASSSPADASRR